MSILEAIILGIIQGLTEFLPVSSSGHLELGKAMLGIEATEEITFTVVVHGATVLSTIVVLRKEILEIFSGVFKFKWNNETQYVAMILLSMIPVGIIGFFFKDEVKSFFNNNVMLVGCMLLITAILLAITYYVKKTEKEVSYKNSLLIGIAQAVAVLPGISRSGATIAIGLLLGVKKETIAKFSFLMVLIPIIGANLKDIASGEMAESTVGVMPLVCGFLAAFISGVFACKWMLGIVKKGKLIYFAAYCALVGGIAIISACI